MRRREEGDRIGGEHRGGPYRRWNTARSSPLEHNKAVLSQGELRDAAVTC